MNRYTYRSLDWNYVTLGFLYFGICDIKEIKKGTDGEDGNEKEEQADHDIGNGVPRQLSGAFKLSHILLYSVSKVGILVSHKMTLYYHSI